MESTSFLKNNQDQLYQILNPKEPFSFLVGAGISMNPPANMPSARQLVKDLFNFCAPREEIDNLVQLMDQGLRYELVVQLIQSYIDPDIKFLDYLDSRNSPNLDHYFLAQCISYGQYVMTTNFDYFIENALITIVHNQNTVIPVITREDYLKYEIPSEWVSKSYNLLYKLHGSKQNAITNEPTLESLTTTIASLGKNRDNGSTFAIELFKKPAIYHLTQDRNLILMGYSGSDDFDLTPTLLELPKLKRLIWINHIANQPLNVVKIERVAEPEILNDENLPRIDRLLLNIASKFAYPVYRIDGDTSKFVDLMWRTVFPSVPLPKKLRIAPAGKSFLMYLEEIYSSVEELQKWHLVIDCYYALGLLPDAQRCTEKALEIAHEQDDKAAILTFTSYLGVIARLQGRFDDAKEIYSSAIKLCDQLNDSTAKAGFLNNMGKITEAQNDWETAVSYYHEAMVLNDEIGDVAGKASNLNNLGIIQDTHGQIREAIQSYEEALQIVNILGDLDRKESILNNLGLLSMKQCQYPKAIEYLNEALHIAQAMGNLIEIAPIQNNLAAIYKQTGDLDKAVPLITDSLKICDLLNDPYNKGKYLSNLGTIYQDQGHLEEALQSYEVALQIAKETQDKAGRALRLSNIAGIYRAQNHLISAIELYVEALSIVREIGDSAGEATDLNNIGTIYYEQKNYETARQYYNGALKIAEEIGDLERQMKYLVNLGLLYRDQEDWQKAMELYNQVLTLARQIGNPSVSVTALINLAAIYSDQRHFDEANSLYDEALDLCEQLEDIAGKATILNNIGRNYQEQGDNEKAIDYYHQSLKIAAEIGYEKLMVTLEKNMSEITSHEE